MLPRLVIAGLLLAVLSGGAFEIFKVISGRQNAPGPAELLEQHRPAAAQAILRQMVRKDPRNAEAHVLLGRTHLALSDPVAAEKEFKVARGLRYDRAILSPLLAQAYMMQGHYDDVLADMPATAARDEELFPNLVARSEAYLALGDTTQAEASLQAAARLLPHDHQVLLVRCRLALARGDLDQAEKFLVDLLKEAPTEVDGLMLQSELLSKRGNVDGALSVLDTALAASPFSVQVRVQRANLLMAKGRDKDAQRDVDSALALDLHNTDALLMNAVLMMRAGHYGDASTEFQKMGSALEDSPRGYYFQALTMSLQDHNSTALDVIGRFRKLHPKDPDGVHLEASLDLKLGQPRRAIDVLTQAVEDGVKGGETYDLLGRAYFMAGQMPEAINSYREATANDPGNADYAAHLSAAQHFTVPAEESPLPKAR